MKVIRYKILSCEVNHGTEEEPNIEQIFFDKEPPYTDGNYAVALKEAYNGEVTVDEVPDPEVPDIPESDDMDWDTMAEAIKEGVNEV